MSIKLDSQSTLSLTFLFYIDLLLTLYNCFDCNVTPELHYKSECSIQFSNRKEKTAPMSIFSNLIDNKRNVWFLEIEHQTVSWYSKMNERPLYMLFKKVFWRTPYVMQAKSILVKQKSLFDLHISFFLLSDKPSYSFHFKSLYLSCCWCLATLLLVDLFSNHDINLFWFLLSFFKCF